MESPTLPSNASRAAVARGTAAIGVALAVVGAGAGRARSPEGTGGPARGAPLGPDRLGTAAGCGACTMSRAREEGGGKFRKAVVVRTVSCTMASLARAAWELMPGAGSGVRRGVVGGAAG